MPSGRTSGESKSHTATPAARLSHLAENPSSKYFQFEQHNIDRMANERRTSSDPTEVTAGDAIEGLMCRYES